MGPTNSLTNLAGFSLRVAKVSCCYMNFRDFWILIIDQDFMLAWIVFVAAMTIDHASVSP